MEIEKKILSPKIDIVFQAIFGEIGNEEITKGLLETILKERIEKIDLGKNPILKREEMNDKLGILDILAEINGNEKCNIELQVIDKDNIIERILYYWSKLYSRQIKMGEDYKNLSKAIIILITNYEIKKLHEQEYHSKWQIMEEEKKTILTKKLEIHIIELPKIKGKEKEEDKLLDWLYFIENPKSERVAKKMKENKELKVAVKKLEKMSEDERMQRIADLREKAILDEKATYSKGLNDGMKEGMKAGMEAGMEKGVEEGRREVILKMYNSKIPLAEIAKIVQINEEELKEIIKSKND